MPMASYCCKHVIVILLHAPSEKSQAGRGGRGREEKGRKYSVLVSQFKHLTTASQPRVLSDREWDHGAETAARSVELRGLQQPNWGLNKDL